MIKPIYLTKYATVTASDWEMVEGTSFPQKVGIIPKTFRGIKTGVMYPPHQVADLVATEELVSYVNATEKKTAFILAAGSGSFAGLRNTLETWNPCNYKVFALTLLQVYAGKMAQRFGKVDLVTTDASACASSLKVLMDAQMLMSCYGFERVVVLSVEDQVSEITQKFFGEARAVISKEQADVGLIPSAFDETNYSFNIAQGAVCAVFESRYSEGAITMLGAYSSAEESENTIGQRPDGEGFYKAASKAIELSGSNQVKIIKTHGTGTKSNNVAEKAAIHKLLGTSGYVATSYKPRIGHTLGPSGLLESCLLFDDIRKTGQVPEILNRTENDPIFLSHSVAAPKGDILSLAAGMGNIYAAAVWRM
jgi:3-oxoacyl-(acyl-carrier-protein) synthase